MSERRLQTRYIPLRVRFRPASEYYERTHGPANTEIQRHTQPLVPDLSHASEGERRSQQIKELIRLGNLLRADLSLGEVLQQIVTSTVTCTGFRRSAINLIDENGENFLSVAFAGLSEEEQNILRESHTPIERMLSQLRPEFRISQSYFIPHEHFKNFAAEKAVVVKQSTEEYVEGRWHPEDGLLVPLYSPRERKLLGVFSLDDPEDGKIPTRESIEILELFAGQAALAIDNAFIFQEREDERAALEEAISQLRQDIQVLQQGDLRRRIRSTHKKLQPVADVIDAMVDELSGILSNMQMVTQAVEDHSHHVSFHSERLVYDTTRQEQYVQHISQDVGNITGLMDQVSELAAHLSQKAVEVVEVTLDAQGAVDRAADGMRAVREATMQSTRTIKALSESGQEINETVMGQNDLTTRMHLLALNAAIEATRAGEHGRGFAVIAQEMRTLATHSKQATNKVSDYIRTIQQETTAVSQSIEQNTQHVIMQTELATEAGVALEAISSVTEKLSNLVQRLCMAAEGQSQSSQQLVSTVNETFQMKADISGHMQQMQQSVLHLTEFTNALRSRMASIHLRER